MIGKTKQDLLKLFDNDKIYITTTNHGEPFKIEIEELDENAQASELLKKVDAEIDVSETIAELRRGISRKKKLSDSDFKDFTKKINQFRKEVK